MEVKLENGEGEAVRAVEQLRLSSPLSPWPRGCGESWGIGLGGEVGLFRYPAPVLPLVGQWLGQLRAGCWLWFAVEISYVSCQRWARTAP